MLRLLRDAPFDWKLQICTSNKSNLFNSNIARGTSYTSITAMESATPAMNCRVCTACQGPGKLACSGCLLVVYCGTSCQKTDFVKHKQWCKSPLAKTTWNPNWVEESRTPNFIGDQGQVRHGGKKYFWGNVPALDIVRLAANEGLEYKAELSLLFAASGDMRNVVKTIASLPNEYTSRTRVVINDLDFEVTARNLIITLISLLVEDTSEAVPCMLHLWYSALIRRSDADIIKKVILPLLQDVNQKIKDKPHGIVLGKTWRLGHNTCRVELSKQGWKDLLLFVQENTNVTAEMAHRTRRTVTLAPHRIDHRDRALYNKLPAHRLCFSRFYEDGLLLPFGAQRDTFVVPSPTFFQSPEWPMSDSASPLAGWSLPEVLSTNSGPASADVFGKLFYHVCEHLTKFHHRLRAHETEFNFLNVNAEALKKQPLLSGREFSRIEVSNISDGGYLGTGRTLAFLGPMLEDKSKNPHATLLTLYMNAVEEASHNWEDQDTSRKNLRKEIERASKFFNFRDMMPSIHSPQLMQMGAATDSQSCQE